eukprot:m.335441 g.335441  ORF g.335441 m.335441 type:complete len:272 (+) comp17593_c0_seq1:99-914(+)
MDEDGEFITVGRKRKGKHKLKTNESTHVHVITSLRNESEDSDSDIEEHAAKLQRTLESYAEEIKHDQLTQCIQDALRQTNHAAAAQHDDRKWKDNIDFVCFGLGNFSSSSVGRWQLAMLLTLTDDMTRRDKCEIYDPCFNALEIKVLQSLGLKLLPTNTLCKHVASSDTVYFMPHCGMDMYHNVLLSNWTMKGLKQVCILGNSFQHYEERTVPSAKARLDSWCLFKCLPFITQKDIPNTFSPDVIFNDLALHYFTQEQLQEIGEQVFSTNK